MDIPDWISNPSKQGGEKMSLFSSGRGVAAVVAASVLVFPANAHARTADADSPAYAEAEVQLADAWQREATADASLQDCGTPPLDSAWQCRRFDNAAGAFVVVFKKDDPAVEARTRIVYSSGEVRSENNTPRDSTNHAVGINGREVLSTPCFADISPCIDEVPSPSSGQRVELAAVVAHEIIAGNHIFTVP